MSPYVRDPRTERVTFVESTPQPDDVLDPEDTAAPAAKKTAAKKTAAKKKAKKK